MRRFYLEREVDESGVSGTGRIAEGVEFDTGDCVLCWLTATSSIGIYRNIKAVKAIHGHSGMTKVHWVDSNDIPDGEVEEKTDQEA